jgi:uncharacterized protein
MNYTPPRRSDGTLQSVRARQLWPQGKPFRILSIDGGGIRGVFPAAYLAELENRFLSRRSIASYFDMIAGTSTGGIIALALAHGMTAAEALAIYRDRGARIFRPRTGVSKWRQTLRWVSKPKHDPAVLKDELLQVFGSAVLDDAKSRLIIAEASGQHIKELFLSEVVQPFVPCSKVSVCS